MAAKHKIPPTQVTTWKRQAIDDLAGVFSDKAKKADDNGAEIKELHARIEKLAYENDLYDGLRVNIHFKAPVAFIQSRQIGDLGSMLVV